MGESKLAIRIDEDFSRKIINLHECAKILIKIHPVFRSMPIGAPGSHARLGQIDQMIAEDNLRAAIAAVEGKL